MSVVKRVIRDSIERLKVDELLSTEFEQAGYGGITLTKTPLGAQITLYTMRPGRVIGKRGRSIKNVSDRLDQELGLSNPQITVIEVEVPELNPRIMASRIANALERGVHFRRAIFWALRRIMDSGAMGCEIVLRGKLRSDRSRFEKVSEGYLPKAGEPSIRYIKKATIHVKMKMGIYGITVRIVPPDAKFPDKITLEGLPEIQVPEEKTELPEGVEPEPAAPEAAPVEPVVEEAQQAEALPAEKPRQESVEKAQTVEAAPENLEKAPVPPAEVKEAEQSPKPKKTGRKEE